MRKANNKIIGFAALSCFSLGVLTSLTNNDAFVFELHNKGAKFVTKVDPEIEGVYASKLTVPSDPVYNTQKSYSMSNVGDIESVWNTTTGKGTTIAVIDDGFAPKHEDYLRADGTSAILPTSRYYYTSNSSVAYKQYSQDASCLNEGWNSTYSELDTHGTNTSSTAAAPMQGKGGVGIAPDADLLLIKIDMSFAAIKSAIQYCIDQKVDVINMSLGAYSSSFKDGFGTQQSGSSSVATYLDSVCVNAYNAGVIVVAAAGNEATSNKSYPACNSHVVGVGALNKGSSTELAPFTNFNSSVSQGDEKNVDILAPGYVYTAKVEATSSTGSWTYTYGDTMGTSFSSPIVAGAASLWCQKNAGQYTGSAKVDAFQKALTSTADGIGDFATRTVAPSKLSSYYSKYGPYTSNIACGTLNVKNLVGEVSQGGSEEVQVTSLTMNKSSLVLDEGATGQLSVTANAGASNAVTWSSSNSAVAKVSANGLVTAVKEGSAVITATSTLNSNVKATCNVTVNKVEEGEEPQVKSSVISMPKFSSNGSTTRSTTTIKNELVDVDGLVSSVAKATNVYSATVGYRLGKSSAAGALTLNLKEKLKVTKIVAKVAKYSSDSTTVTINNVKSSTLSSTSLYDLTFTYSGSEVSTIAITNSSKRFYLASLTVYYENGSSSTGGEEETPTVQKSYTLSYADTFSPALPTSSSTRNTSVKTHTDTTSGISFGEKGLYKSSSSKYIMFYKNAGYLYNTTSLGKIVSIAVTYGSSTSSSGKIGVYIGGSALSTYSSSSNSTIAGAGKTSVFTVTSGDYEFFQISTSNANVQIVSIVITVEA